MADLEVLVVDDDEGCAEALGLILTQDGLGATRVPDAERALAVLEKRAFDLIVTDVRMPGMSGLQLLLRLRATLPEVPVVLITAHEDTRTAVEAMRAGARDFMMKPLRREDVLRVVRKELNAARAGRELPPPIERREASGLLGDSAPLRAARETLGRAAASDLRVLLLGEPGTGKELAARALHAGSTRAGCAFVAVNCAAIPAELFEAEMFGYAKGAFTGAACDKPGRIELAEGGTLFLDELGDLPLEAQAKLLRVLQDGDYCRVGEAKPRRADVRLVSATNRALDRLRADLLERVNGVTIRLPPLREHRGDVALLARHFLALHGAAATEAALEALRLHDWPGNVRELQNCLHRLVVFSADRARIDAGDVRRELERHAVDPAEPAASPKPRRAIDRAALEDALARTGNNKTEAAQLLGVSRRTLYYKLAEHGL